MLKDQLYFEQQGIYLFTKKLCGKSVFGDTVSGLAFNPLIPYTLVCFDIEFCLDHNNSLVNVCILCHIFCCFFAELQLMLGQ